jgi:phosphatidylinositol alpha-1,6-mannosyltransferase
LYRLAGEMDVLGAITWCGRVDDDMLPVYYHLATIFIMVSRYLKKEGDAEGYGIVYLEANAAGVPVIAGRSGGATDAVIENESGLLVDDPADPQEVAQAIVKLAQNPGLREKLETKGYEWAKRADWETRRKLWQELNAF